MSDHNDGGPAFPQAMNTGLVRMSGDGVLEVDKEVLGGMSLRDWFAGQALGHALSRDYGNDWGKAGSEHVTRACRHAYAIADALLAARNSTPTKGA